MDWLPSRQRHPPNTFSFLGPSDRGDTAGSISDSRRTAEVFISATWFSASNLTTSPR